MKPDQTPTTQATQHYALAAALLTLLIWGGTAIANKFAVAHMSGLSAGVLRSMLAGLIALVIASSLRLPFPRANSERALLLVSGLASFAFWPVLMSMGIARTTASHAGLIMVMIPLFTVLIQGLVQRKLPAKKWWLGASVAQMGAIYLMFNRSGMAADTAASAAANTAMSEVGKASLTGDLLVLLGCLVCAVGYVAGGRLSAKIGTASTTFWGLAVALIFLLPAFGLIMADTNWASVPLQGWLAIAWMCLLSSLAGYGLWFYALGKGGIGRIATLQLLQPMITLLLAAALLGEVLSLPLLTSAVMILLGTYFAQSSQSRAAK